MVSRCKLEFVVVFRNIMIQTMSPDCARVLGRNSPVATRLIREDMVVLRRTIPASLCLVRKSSDSRASPFDVAEVTLR
jgi:hypothetical protein